MLLKTALAHILPVWIPIQRYLGATRYYRSWCCVDQATLVNWIVCFALETIFGNKNGPSSYPSVCWHLCLSMPQNDPSYMSHLYAIFACVVYDDDNDVTTTITILRKQTCRASVQSNNLLLAKEVEWYLFFLYPFSITRFHDNIAIVYKLRGVSCRHIEPIVIWGNVKTFYYIFLWKCINTKH